MATPSASTLMSDVAQWTKAMEMGNRILCLCKILNEKVETVVSVANKAEKIDPKSDIERRLQQSMKDLCEPGKDVLAVSISLLVRENQLTGYLKQAVEGKSTDSPTDIRRQLTTKANSSQPIEISTVENCIKEIETILKLADTFAKSIGIFREKIEAAKQVCQHLQQLEKEKQKLNIKKALGIFGGVSAVALGIAGFFTFGTTWAGAAALGAAAGGGAVAVGMTYLDSEKLDKEINELNEAIRKFSPQLNELESLSENLTKDEVVLSEIKESIEFVLKLYKEKQNQFEREQKLQEENRMLKQKESEQEEEIRKLKERLEKLDKY